MATIQIRDVPDETYEALRKRAQVAGMSLQAYMREELIKMVKRRPKDEVMDGIEAMIANYPPGIRLPTVAETVAAIRESRGE
ncbi:MULTISPECIES: antitoxin [unclassified Crossiella]|uniref:FitA-like ribbon-helix-helix domain-containing protein n=1 Tax=unclassified Crossiella TaxID=2620835 RepID=UPI001FFEE337|nr:MULTISPECIES: antitoxin [unclassified Crossiella]MCK2240370.1 antitoxin [Crossiella sp. S99.2]MCK2253178.1 antitoxin [Crossiella sp. S99.1]